MSRGDSSTSESPRLLYVGNFLSKQFGTRAVCEDLTTRLRDRGWSIVTTSSRSGRFMKGVDMLRVVWGARHSYDLAVVDTFSGAAFNWAEATGALCRLISKPYILVLHGGRLPEFAEEHSGRVKRLILGAAGVVTPSRFLHDHFATLRGDIQVIVNPIEISRYNFRQRRCIKPRLVWLRAFRKEYNPVLVPQVVIELLHDFPEIEVLMIGPERDASLAVLTKKIARDGGVEDRVKFVGPVAKKDVPYWLDQGDIFINTTQYESFGVAVMEAGAAGLCIVTTNVGEIPFIWKQEEEALLVAPGDASAMAAAVGRLLREPELVGRLSQAARKKAEVYDWSVVIPKWESFLKSV